MITRLRGTRVTDRFVYNPLLAVYLPFHEMEVGRSNNLLSWSGSAPSTGWTGARSTLSEVTTPTPPVSAKAMGVLCNNPGPGDLGVSYAYQAVAAYTKYAGITATMTAQCNAPTANDKTQLIQISDGVGSGSSSTVTKHDTNWYVMTASRLLSASLTRCWASFVAKSESTADIDDILYGDNPILTVPQAMDRSHYGRVLHPEGVSRSWKEIEGWLFDGTDDLVTCETDPIGANACTIAFTMRPTGWGGGNNGQILSNGKLNLSVYDIYTGIVLTSDALTLAYSAAGSIALNNVYRVIVTRTAAGVANIYINKDLSGAADQASGTPSATSTTLLTIGNRLAGDRGMAGIIRDLAVYVGEVWGATQVSTDYAEYMAGNR